MSNEHDTEQQAPAALVAAAPEPVASRVKHFVLNATPPPKPVPGLELIGRMEDSGFVDPPYLVRRADGQVVQLPELLYLTLEAAVAGQHYGDLARDVSERFGALIDPEDAKFLIEQKLRPLGLMCSRDRLPPSIQRAEIGEKKPGDDLLALTWKARVVPEGAVRRITTIFKPLFATPVVVVAVLAFFGLLGWFFGVHGIAQTVRAILYDPALLVFVFAGVIVATAFHELGHATACRYGGARPGVLGIGLYVIWPVFYTDVTDAYRLGRGGRLRTDFGGIYFNVLFALGCGAIYFATRWEPVLLLVIVQTFTIVQQVLPLGRLDGYLILTDLTGVPDLLTRMKPILRSVIPGRPADDRVKDLKPWVRRVATGYIALLIPILAFIVAMMLIHAPRVMATAHDSAGVRWDQTRAAFSGGHYWLAGGSLLQCAALVLPAVGMSLTSMRIGKRLGGAALAWSAGAPTRRAAVIAATVATAGTATYTWAPNGEYRPIQPNERGTLQAGVKSLEAVPTGRPALTEARAAQLQGAPTERQLLRRHEQDPTLRRHLGWRRRALRHPGEKAPAHGEGPGTADDGSTSEPSAPTTPLPSGTGSGRTMMPTDTSTTSPSADTGTTTTPSGTTPTPTDTSTTTTTGTSTTPTETSTSPTPSGTTTTPSTTSTGTTTTTTPTTTTPTTTDTTTTATTTTDATATTP